MAKIKVSFEYIVGTALELFENVRLTGSWDESGRYSENWLVAPMQAEPDKPGCCYSAQIELEESETGKEFYWGVLVDAPGRPDLPGVMSERDLPGPAGPSGQSGPPDLNGQARAFTLQGNGQTERYMVTPNICLGANRRGGEKPGIVFSVWAPNARNVETVIADGNSGGYIYDNGKGVAAAFAMTRDNEGIWSTLPEEPELADYGKWEGRGYMFRITREDGSVAYRTDMFSRGQAGYGAHNPATQEWNGKAGELECTKSCSVVKNPESLHSRFTMPEGMPLPDDDAYEAPGDKPEAPAGAGEAKDKAGTKEAEEVPERISPDEFWKDEFDPLRPVPNKPQDLIIYELHVAGLGAGRDTPGTLADAMNMLDYLEDLGVNAVELLPMSSFDGLAGWGYGSSHFYAIKYEPEARDQFKHFVRACHQRGIAVIVDVVYNHYSPDNERCQWMYDTTRHDHNMFYYYKGKEEDYPGFPDGGYCDNMSTGYLPNVAEEKVCKLMIGSAVNMALDYHVDGFRMDLTQALHSFNVLHKDGTPVPEANEAGIRFMREWARTLRFFRPSIMLLAEDHSGWNMVDRSEITSGIGFDAIWWSEWYHQLIGDSDQDSAKAHLLRESGFGTDKPLAMDTFGKMVAGAPGKIVYHESHDESGNSAHSARNIEVAVNGMLLDNTRPWAEARCRVAAGLTLLSAGTPMFFMGEEVCAREPYRFSDFLEHREDYRKLRAGSGAGMFAFYQDVIRLRRDKAALRSPFVEVLKVHDQDRVIAYRRWWNNDEFLVVATLKDNGFPNGYDIAHDSLKGKVWYELLNSDKHEYGGGGLGNGDDLNSESGSLNLKIPPCSITVLARKN